MEREKAHILNSLEALVEEVLVVSKLPVVTKGLGLLKLNMVVVVDMVELNVAECLHSSLLDPLNTKAEDLNSSLHSSILDPLNTKGGVLNSSHEAEHHFSAVVEAVVMVLDLVLGL